MPKIKNISKNQKELLRAIYCISRYLNNLVDECKMYDRYKYYLSERDTQWRGNKLSIIFTEFFKLYDEDSMFLDLNRTKVKSYYRSLNTLEKKGLVKIERDNYHYIVDVNLTKKGINFLTKFSNNSN